MVRKADFWSGAFWLCVAAFLVWQGLDLGLGKVNDPGSGFAVFWIGLLLGAFALSVIVASAREDGPSLADLWAGTSWGRVLTVVVLLVVYAVSFERIGFVVLTVALLLVLMLVVDRVRPSVAIPVAVVTPLIVWVAMTRWLLIQLPAGVLAGIL